MKITKITACIIPLLFVGGCTLGVAGVDAGSSVMVSSVLALFALPFVGLIENSIDRKRHPEKYAEKKRKREAELQAYEKAQKEKDDRRRQEQTIVEVKMIGGGSSVHKRYGLGGAVVGGLLFNIPGAIVGAMIPKGSEQLQRFIVKYGDGHIETKDVHPNSREYKQLIKHVKLEDLK
jgi:hypothetical protein